MLALFDYFFTCMRIYRPVRTLIGRAGATKIGPATAFAQNTILVKHTHAVLIALAIYAGFVGAALLKAIDPRRIRQRQAHCWNKQATQHYDPSRHKSPQKNSWHPELDAVVQAYVLVVTGSNLVSKKDLNCVSFWSIERHQKSLISLKDDKLRSLYNLNSASKTNTKHQYLIDDLNRFLAQHQLGCRNL